jgi:hypothetical protein
MTYIYMFPFVKLSPPLSLMVDSAESQ